MNYAINTASQNTHAYNGFKLRPGIFAVGENAVLFQVFNIQVSNINKSACQKVTCGLSLERIVICKSLC